MGTGLFAMGLAMPEVEKQLVHFQILEDLAHGISSARGTLLSPSSGCGGATRPQ